MIAATPTPTPEFANASADVVNAFGDSSGLFPVIVFLVYVVAAIAAAQFVAPWLAQSKLLTRFGQRVALTVTYAIKGVAATAVLAVAAAPIWFIATADAGTRGVALRWVGYAVGAFAALAVIGYLADRAVAAFIDAHPEYDSWDDIWDEPDEELGEPEVAD